MDMWYQCEECVFGSNSSRQAQKHEDDTGHKIYSEKESSVE